MVPGKRGWGFAVFAITAMLAPSLAARNAIAKPMPRLAPVTNNVQPFEPRCSTQAILLGLLDCAIDLVGI
jgi:hypothetical protein